MNEKNIVQKIKCTKWRKFHKNNSNIHFSMRTNIKSITGNSYIRIILYYHRSLLK